MSSGHRVAGENEKVLKEVWSKMLLRGRGNTLISVLNDMQADKSLKAKLHGWFGIDMLRSDATYDDIIDLLAKNYYYDPSLLRFNFEDGLGGSANTLADAYHYMFFTMTIIRFILWNVRF